MPALRVTWLNWSFRYPYVTPRDPCPMTTRLTALGIDKLKPGTSRREIADGGCPGLYIVVQTSGSKSWAVRCRLQGKPVKITVGLYPLLDLLAARERARQTARARRPRHRSSATLKASGRSATRRANALRAVAEGFRDKHMKKMLGRRRGRIAGLGSTGTC